MAGGPAPSSCPGSDPEILVTVSGSSGTITWLGETWNLPTDSGVQKTVCPTSYALAAWYADNASSADYDICHMTN